MLTCCSETWLQVFGVPSVSARFGTSPDPWNWGMVAMARLAPKGELLKRRVAFTRRVVCSSCPGTDSRNWGMVGMARPAA